MNTIVANWNINTQTSMKNLILSAIVGSPHLKYLPSSWYKSLISLYNLFIFENRVIILYNLIG